MADTPINGNAPTLVVLQLTGANDYLNTVVPYTNPLYYDNRPTLHIAPEQVLPIDDKVGFHPHMQTIKRLYDAGKVAIIHGIGYPNPNYSHFRSMDIWDTCEPDKVSTEGWLGKVVRDLDPQAENVLTAVNFGRGLPRALALSGVPVASVAQLDTYGVLTTSLGQRARRLWRRSRACTAAATAEKRCCAIWGRPAWMRRRAPTSYALP